LGEEVKVKDTGSTGEKSSRIRNYTPYGATEYVISVVTPYSKKRKFATVINRETIEKWASKNGLEFVPNINEKYGGYYKSKQSDAVYSVQVFE
jgi:hypothetical protein